MKSSDLEALFSELAMPSPGSFAARPLSFGAGQYRVARQSDGAPALLILIKDLGEAECNEHLANLSYSSRVRLRVESPEGTVDEAVYSVLICRSPDTELRHYFFRIASALIDELGAAPKPVEIDAGIRRLLELFRALERPGRRSLQGIWAELLLILHSSSPSFAISAWHAEPEATYDFAAGLDRLEVKSTAQTIRLHHFRLEQLAPPPSGRLVVASLMLTPTENGLNLTDLVDRLSALLPRHTEHRSRLEAIVASAIGRSWRLMSSTAFDEQGALASLRFFASTSIPSVEKDIPVQVSDVRFLVDLSGVPVEDVDLREKSPLFLAILPKPAVEHGNM